MTAVLRDLPGIRMIYQIGSIRHPGISDIDIVAVFDDDARVEGDVRDALPPASAYFFTHRPMGILGTDFETYRRYTLFDYRLLWKRPGYTLPGVEELTAAERRALEVQIGYEYLVKMFMYLSVRRAYGVVGVRSLLLQASAIRYDLAFLSIDSGEVYDLVETLVGWREQWFDAPPAGADVRAWIEAFHAALYRLLEAVSGTHTLYMLGRGGARLARHMRLVQAPCLRFEHRGVLLPRLLSHAGRLYYALQNRLNRFVFYLPASASALPDVVRERFECIRRMEAGVAARLPRFMPPCSNVRLY